jgi:hypothetical protein
MIEFLVSLSPEQIDEGFAVLSTEARERLKAVVKTMQAQCLELMFIVADESDAILASSGFSPELRPLVANAQIMKGMLDSGMSMDELATAMRQLQTSAEN